MGGSAGTPWTPGTSDSEVGAVVGGDWGYATLRVRLRRPEGEEGEGEGAAMNPRVGGSFHPSFWAPSRNGPGGLSAIFNSYYSFFIRS